MGLLDGLFRFLAGVPKRKEEAAPVVEPVVEPAKKSTKGRPATKKATATKKTATKKTATKKK